LSEKRAGKIVESSMSQSHIVLLCRNSVSL